MKAMNVYEIKIFQEQNLLMFMFNCKSETAPLIFHNLLTIKPRNRYTIRATNMLREVFCCRKFSEFKIPFRGPHLWNKLIVQNNTKNLIPFKRKLKDLIASKMLLISPKLWLLFFSFFQFSLILLSNWLPL